MRETTKNSIVKIEEDYVIKFLKEDEDLNKTLEKHEKLNLIGIKYGFESPKILEGSIANHSITFKRIELPLSLNKNFQEDLNKNTISQKNIEVSKNLGAILAFIHNELKLSSKSEPPVSNSFMQSLNKHEVNLKAKKAFLHGDFSLNNIHLTDDKIIILDPLPNYHSTFYVDEWNETLIDLAILCNSIIRQVSYKKINKQNRSNLKHSVGTAINEYERVSNCKIDLQNLAKYCYAVDCAIANKCLKSNLRKKIRSVISKNLIFNILKA